MKMKKKFLYYIDNELQDEYLTSENRDWLKILKEYYLGASIKELAVKYDKSIPTLYRRKKQLEEQCELGGKYRQRKKRNNKLTIQQKEEVKKTIKDSPYKIGFLSTEWTGQLLKKYIDYVYKVELTVRSCQRLLASYREKSSEVQVVRRYTKTMQEFIKQKYEIWHIRDFIIWKEKKLKVPEGMLQFASKVEGVFLAYNPINKEHYYKPYNNKGYNTYSALIDEFIDEKSNKDGLVLIFLDNKKSRKKIINMNDDKYYNGDKYLNVKVIIRPKKIKEIKYIYDKRKFIKNELLPDGSNKWTKVKSMYREEIKEKLGKKD